MTNDIHVIRQAFSTLVIYRGTPAAVYKLNQQDVPRLEQATGARLDFMAQSDLQAALERLSLGVLPLDDGDRAELARVGLISPTAPPTWSGPADTTQAATPRPARPMPPTRPAGTPPAARPTARPATATASAQAGSTAKPTGNRGGLIAAVIALAVLALLVLWLLNRLFAQPGNTSTPTALAQPSSTALTTTVIAVDQGATATALGNVSVRSGPGEVYPVIGLLPAGGSAAITGKSADGLWWLLQGDNIQGGQGWAAAERIQASNAAAVPVLTPPPVPTTTPTPLVTFRGWKGEYFDNPNLQAPPALVQDDGEINFNWGQGAAAAGLPTDNFSVRWSRRIAFEEANYRLQATVQGGLRVWVDGRPLLDDWQNGPGRVLTADTGVLTRGEHSVVVEYLSLEGGAQVALSWQQQAAQPPTAVITGPAQGMTGSPLRFDATGSTAAAGRRIVSYAWRFGDGSNSDQAQADKTYAVAGTFDITLVVTDDAGLSGVASQQIIIAVPTATPTAVAPPNAVITGPEQATAGVAVTFDGSSSTPSGGLSEYRWSFGDGDSATGPTVNHVFAQPGSYSVRLTVISVAGQSADTSRTVQVSAATATTTPPPALQGTSWVLQNTLAGSTATANFQNGVISGNGGCNTYDGSFSTTGQGITFGPLSISTLTCETAIMEQENQYLARLQVASSYEISNDELRLRGVIGTQAFELVFRRNRP